MTSTARSASVPSTGMPVPQPVPGRGGGASPDSTPLTARHDVERVTPGRVLGTAAAGLGIAILPAAMVASVMADSGASDAKAFKVWGGGVIAGAVLAVGIGAAVAAARGHSYLTKRRTEDMPGFDGPRADAAISAGLVGATTTMAITPSTSQSLQLTKVLAMSTSLADATATLYDKATIDAARADPAHQRVIVRLPRTAGDDRPQAWVTYEAAPADTAGKAKDAIVVPKALVDRGLAETLPLDGALVASTEVQTKLEQRGNEIWELRGDAQSLERITRLDSKVDQRLDYEQITTGEWHQRSERYLRDAGASGSESAPQPAPQPAH
jgi:hypothetical protein